jgi:hypothetical protein
MVKAHKKINNKIIIIINNKIIKVLQIPSVYGKGS